MGNHRTERRKLFRLQQRINQEARIAQLEVALHTVQQVGEHVPPVHTQHQQELNEAAPPVQQKDTNPVPSVVERVSDHQAGIEDINLAPSEVNKNALAENFEDAATHAPTKPYSICTGIWVFTKDNTLARSGITIW